MRKVLGFALLFAALSGRCFAIAVPEIDPGSILSAMTLLTCGVLVFTDRRRKK